MKVLLVNPYIRAGGAEVRIRLLIDRLKQHPAIDEVHFLTFGQPAHRSEENVHFWRTLKGKVERVVGRLIDKFRIDVAQQHNFQEIGTWAVVAAKRKGVPAVFVAHDYHALCPHYFLVNVFRAIDQPLCYEIDEEKCSRCVGYYEFWKTKKHREDLEHCDVGVAASKRMIDIFERNGFLEGKWRVITPWVDVDTFKPEPGVQRKMQCCTLNNYLPHKGAWVALKAWAIVSKRLPDAVLQMQGDVRWLSQMIDMIKTLKLRNVNLLKRMEIEKLRRLYCESWFTVVPSIWEATFELVRGESLLCGTPVIASRIGSIPETSAAGHVLFEPRNHEELAEKMIDLFLDPEKAGRLAKEGREYALKTFHPQRAAEQFINLYDELIGG